MYAGECTGKEVCKLLALSDGQVTWNMLEMSEEKQNHITQWQNNIIRK